MSSSRPTVPRVAWCLLLLAAALPQALAATGDAGGAAAPVQDLERLKLDVIAVDSTARRLEESILYPAPARLTIDVSDGVPGLLLHEVTVTLDNDPPVHYVCDNRAAQALTHGGLQRVLEYNIAPGTHHLHAEFSATLGDSPPSAAPVTGTFDQSFEKARGEPLLLELALAKDDRWSAPAFNLHYWTAAP